MNQKPMGACVLWAGQRNGDGYGQISRPGGGSVPAHRAAWTTERGPIPSGLELDHLCRNRACVNLQHLELVTHAENMRRSRLLVGRMTCRSGHDLTEVGVYEYPSGKRNCRECKRRWARESRARKAVSA